MNILFLQAGYDINATPFRRNSRESILFAQALGERGHTYSHFGPRMNTDTSILLNQQYDMVFMAEQYDMQWVVDTLEFMHRHGKLQQGILFLQWVIDAHVFNNDPFERYQAFLGISHYVIHANRDHMGYAQKQYPKAKHLWFPNGSHKLLYEPLKKAEKTQDVGFVGHAHFKNRRDMFTQLKKEEGFKFSLAQKYGMEMARFIRSCRLHLNLSISTDINYRAFETMGFGTCLLTNWIPDMEELGFKDGENCITYQTYDECVEKIHHALKSGQWKEIAPKGHEFSKEHTYEKRIERFLPDLFPKLL